VKRFLRRIRGVIATGITWSIGWCVAFLGIGLFTWPTLGDLPVVAASATFFGFISGVSFALILSVAERRRTLDQLSLWRVALWGFIGTTALLLLLSLLLMGPELSFRHIPVLAYDGLLGAGLASGSVALARQGDTKLIEGEEESVLSLEGNLDLETGT
jgi:hypothetical protein